MCSTWLFGPLPHIWIYIQYSNKSFLACLKVRNLKTQYPCNAYVLMQLEHVKVITTKGFMRNVITHPCQKFNGGLTKPPLKLGHGSITTPYSFTLMWLFIHHVLMLFFRTHALVCFWWSTISTHYSVYFGGGLMKIYGYHIFSSFTPVDCNLNIEPVSCFTYMFINHLVPI